MDLGYYRETRSLLTKQIDYLDQQLKLALIEKSEFKIGDKVTCKYDYRSWINLADKTSYLKCVVLDIKFNNKANSISPIPCLVYVVVPIESSRLDCDGTIKVIEVTDMLLIKGWNTDECR